MQLRRRIRLKLVVSAVQLKCKAVLVQAALYPNLKLKSEQQTRVMQLLGRLRQLQAVAGALAVRRSQEHAAHR